jgi:DNA-binding response OmpR family regulator
MTNILIIEDAADIAAIERDYLSLAGFDVTIEVDGVGYRLNAVTG